MGYMITKFNGLLFENHTKFLKMLGFDFLFILSIIFTRYFVINFNKYAYAIIPKSVETLTSTILFILMALIFILIYSVFKFKVLLVIQKIIGGNKEEKKLIINFNQFFSLNVFLFIPILIIVILFSLFASKYLNPTLQPIEIKDYVAAVAIMAKLIITSIIGFVLFLMVYIFVNLSHSIFINKEMVAHIYGVVIGALGDIVDFKKYRRLYYCNLKLLLISLSSLTIIHFFIKFFILNTPLLYFNYLSYYKTFIAIISFLFLYYILIFNRINFYLLTKKTEGLLIV